MAFKMKGFSPFNQGFFKRLKKEGVKSAIKGSLPARSGGVLKDEYGRMFKKMGKNTSRGLRIKKSNTSKTSKKKEGDNYLVSFQMENSKNKGKHGAGCARNVCKITCKKKSK